MKWVKINEDHNVYVFPYYLFARCWGKRIKPILGENYDNIQLVFKGSKCWYHGEPTQYKRLGKRVFRKIMKEKFDYKFDAETRKHLERIIKKSDSLLKTDFRKKSNKELGRMYLDFADSIEELNSWGQMVSIMEYGENNFVSGGLEEYLAEQAKKLDLSTSFAKDTSILITPTEETFMRKERREILDLAKKISSRNNAFNEFTKKPEEILVNLKKYPRIKKKIEEINKKYCWITFGYIGPAYTETNFIRELQSVLASKKTIAEQRKDFEGEFRKIASLQKELEEKYKINKEFKRRFEIARRCMFLKEYRKQVLFKAFYSLEKLQKEIARRLSISLEQLRTLLPEEALEALRKGKISSSELNSRLNLCVFVVKNGKTFVASGKKAEKLANKFLNEQKKFEKIKELKGNCASPGNAIGKAKIVLGTSHLYKLRQGDILVSIQTNPQMVPSLKKVAAIVTDQGGIICHAAIISRELKIPCVIGTKIATSVIKDNQIVEVNATEGIVKVLRK